jgi:hypothetical protein
MTIDNPSSWTAQGFRFGREYNRELAAMFSASTALTLTSGELGKKIPALASKAAQDVRAECNVGQFFEAAYNHLRSQYRAEYIYKNTIARNILIGRHSAATTRMFTEFRVEQSKADVVLVNGTTTVYEIKTELDSLDRLSVQLDTYCRVFEKVFVVTHESIASRAAAMSPRSVGVLVLTDRGSLRTNRDATSNLSRLSLAAMFDTMRKIEYTSVIEDVFGSVPDVPNALIHRECKRKFMSLDKSEAHCRLVQVLKSRDRKYLQARLVQVVPSSLTSLCLTTGLTEDQATSFVSALHRPLMVA